jgi:hypothetical protein
VSVVLVVAAVALAAVVVSAVAVAAVLAVAVLAALVVSAVAAALEDSESPAEASCHLATLRQWLRCHCHHRGLHPASLVARRWSLLMVPVVARRRAASSSPEPRARVCRSRGAPMTT